MIIANTRRGAFERESVAELVKNVANSAAEEISEAYTLVDDIEVYFTDREVYLINEQIHKYKAIISDNVRDTEFYNQETARLRYD